jgi:hypothetical protein
MAKYDYLNETVKHIETNSNNTHIAKDISRGLL